MRRRPATNLIQRALDQLGIDWRSPRYGRPRVAGDAATIVVDDAGAFGPLIGPMRADGRMDLDARQPPSIMHAHAWRKAPFWRNEARANLQRVSAVLEERLGLPETIQSAGMMTRRWHDQAGSIVLTCTPDAPGDPDGGDARIARACSISITPGWRRPLSEAEMLAIGGMSVIGRGSPRGVRMLTTAPATDDDSAYVREPGPEPAKLDAIIGVDAVTGLLVACPGRLIVIPIDAVRGLRHESLREGTASGRSTLYAVLDSGRDVVVGEHDETHGLELVSRGLSRALNLAIDRIEAIAS